MNLSNYNCKYFGGSETLSSYLADIRKYPVLSASEEENVFERIHGGDPADAAKARIEIVEHNQRFVYALAKIYARNEDEVLDYVNEGNIELIGCIDSFNPSLGFKFITHAVNYIKRGMNYYFNTTNHMVKRPNHTKIGKKVDVIKNKFYAKHGYMPTDTEVVELLEEIYDIKVKDKSDVFDVSVTSISENLDEDSDFTMENNKEYSERTSSRCEYETSIDNDYNTSIVHSILSTIPAKAQDIIKMYMGIGYERKYSLDEIGVKYDLDRHGVIEMKNNILNYLKQNKNQYKLVI